MGGLKRQLFKHFKQPNGSSSVVSLYIFKETCTLLELSFHAEFHGLGPKSIY